jgi:hypothetical protein
MDVVDPSGTGLRVLSVGRVAHDCEEFETEDGLPVPVDFHMSRELGGVQLDGRIVLVCRDLPLPCAAPSVAAVRA